MAKSEVSRYQRHLSSRFILFLFGVLGLVSACFLLMFYYFYNQQIAEERTQASHSVSLLLKSSLERAMLRRDLPGLRDIISDMVKHEGVAEVMILNPNGEVRFASRPERLGISAEFIIQEFCPNCTPSALPLEPVSRFFTPEGGPEMLRTFHPVRNKPECVGCHGSPATHPVNGILVVDHDATQVRQKAWVNILALVAAGGIALLFSALAAWWFMKRYVLGPISALDHASEALSQGDLGARVDIPGHDEMANLAQGFNHMAERLQLSMRALSSRQQFLQGVMDAVPDGLRVINPRHQIVMANRTYAEMAGYESPSDLRDKLCYQVTCQEAQACPPSLKTCPLTTLTPERPTLKFMEALAREDGSSLSTEVFAARLPEFTEVDGNTEDLIIESVRNLEQAVQFSHEQKLAAMGELAAGVAHEIHNPLASIRIALQASSEIMVESEQVNSELKSYLHLVDEQVEQCLGVTRRLMRLGSLTSNHPELVEVNRVIEETLSLLRFEREQRGIEQQLHLAAGNPRILAADNDLRMIVLNLVQNAFHAMPSGGALTIRTEQGSGHVNILVQDTGMGIADDILPYIFDPFFSRRIDQAGSGLGLAICRSLVRQHKGEIKVAEHAPGQTVFFLQFPDVDAPEQG